MAHLFELAAECGAERSNAKRFAKSFHGLTWPLIDGTVVNCSFRENDVWEGPDHNWWCRVVPDGVSRTGQKRKVIKDAFVAKIARLLYENLKICEGFRFARVGWEVGESFQFDDLLHREDKGIAPPPGLVVSQQLWSLMGSPVEFVPFGVASLWKPLQGRDYVSLVEL